ncbi:MAG TPA: polysaccharide biosynthesis tyrosine autokinase [Lacibacter sp.]|nr:polysaccharide biosynthesis tyrosine autokinase [Lacibacter sp.]HMO90214.1 polysaccharide biosynthesis tyrosine autokinase [Lacibacter sp.]HMP86268.1 polysaccharide biosynthesis tyrosine autokinase [Lacibacter sp.]
MRVIKDSSNTANRKEQNLLGQLWFKYFPYWPLFFIFILLFLAGGWVYLRYATPQYEASAAILIKDDKKGEDESKVIESLNQLSVKKIMENEAEVIRSRSLMVEVVKKLHLYAPIFEEQSIRTVSAYEHTPVKIQVLNPDSLQETPSKVNFRYDHKKQQVIIGTEQFKLNEWVPTAYGTLKFVPNNVNGTFKDPLHFYLVDPKKVTINLLQRLDISPANKLSTIIVMKIRDENPRCAEDILNELMNAYNRAAVNDKNVLASNTLQFLEDRLGRVGNQLDTIERKLQQYKTSSGAIEIGSQGSLYLQNVGAIDQKMAEVNTQLSVLTQIENYVKSKNNTGGIVPSTVGVSDPLLSDLVNKLYDSELQYEKLKRTTAENNPMLVSINDQIDKIKPSILENIRNQRAGLEANRSNLNTLTNRYSSMLSSIPQKERNLVEISRNHSIISNVYNFLLQKREETALSLTSTVANSRIIDKAQASFGPVSPNNKLIYLIAICAALALAIAIITANELINPTVLFRHEIEEFTSIPVIGEIIFNDTKEAIVIGAGKRSFIAEQFRNLRTSLPYLGVNAAKKRVLVTSTISGEGKSFVAANLGVSVAISGKKVVLMEFDLSDPTLCQKLGVETEDKIGLSEYLSGIAEPGDLVRPSGIHENLFVISSGKLPENPSELIMNKLVPELLDYLNEQFDMIIMDTAPVGLLSDAYVLSAYTDATLYMVRHRYTPKTSVQRIDENNKINELKNMAIVFNGVKSRGFGKKGYGYGYGYGYISNDTRKDKRKSA